MRERLVQTDLRGPSERSRERLGVTHQLQVLALARAWRFESSLEAPASSAH